VDNRLASSHASSAAPLLYAERIGWRVTKDIRIAEARIRDLPHAVELRFVIFGEGRDEHLMHSCVVKPGEGAGLLETWSTAVQRDFIAKGWAVQRGPTPRS